MASRRKLERQRERIVELLRADPERSSRSIAAELGCSHHTVTRLRGQPGQTPADDRPGNGQRPGSANLIPPAGPGNDRAVTHGAYSEARRAPLEDLHRERLRAEFPNALASPGGDDLVNLAARRLAAADLLSAWIDDAGPIFARGGAAEVSAPAKELRVLMDGHERAILALRELEVEATTPDPVSAVRAYIDEIRTTEATADE
jgi:hypothetical protein